MSLTEERAKGIIDEAIKLETEQPWIELKINNSQPDLIGEYISALSNSAALYHQDKAYLIWGISDKEHSIVGTKFNPAAQKVGNENIQLWLSKMLDPYVYFDFYEVDINGQNVVIMEINRAASSPVMFKGIDYIRIESNNKKLKEYPDLEKELWSILSGKSFEDLSAIDEITADDVLRMLDYPAYFDLLNRDLPSDKSGIVEALIADSMVRKLPTGKYSITNLGAILFAKDLSAFPFLRRKAVRVINYDGNSRMSVVSHEQIGQKGYANGFDGLIGYINNLLPENEVLGSALRRTIPMYPELAIRELVANAIIHQDFSIRGVSPIIEIFSDRLEISNPGYPLIEIDRFVDHPPISRNEKMAAFMRRIGVCEERGSGYDKVVFQTELFQLPAPEIQIYDNSTRVSLFAYMPYAKMNREDRLRACYLHACLKRVNREYMTNSSLRERFNIETKNSSMVSRLLGEACEAGLVKIAEEASSDKNRKYLPYWG